MHYEKNGRGVLEPVPHPDANVARPGTPAPPKPLSPETIRRINKVVEQVRKAAGTSEESRSAPRRPL